MAQLQPQLIVVREQPLAEITLRKYEKPFTIEGRVLIKKLCLSIGLLQPGDSRDVVVDVLAVVLRAPKPLTSEDVAKKVKEYRKQHNLSMLGIAHSNIRRQLRRIKELYIIERNRNTYRITEAAPLQDIFEEKIETYLVKPTVERIREYFIAANAERGSEKAKGEQSVHGGSAR